MKCEDYDDLLPVVSNYTIFDCSVAVAYGACELEPVVFNHMCCESCSNPTCQDYDDVLAGFGIPMVQTCSDAVLYGMCADETISRICCESCSNPTSECAIKPGCDEPADPLGMPCGPCQSPDDCDGYACQMVDGQKRCALCKVCEDDDEGFVYNASLYGFALTSCAEDAPGLCKYPEPASLCCATCAEALMKCEDYNGILPLVTNYTILECRMAVAYGVCEDEGLNHM